MIKKYIKEKFFTEKSNDIPVQDLIPIDIDQGCIQFKNSFLASGVKIEPFNYFLLSNEDKRQRKGNLNEVLSGIEEEFKIFVIERPIDLNYYINHLENKKQETDDQMKKKLLNSYMRFASSFSNSYDCVEKMFFVMIYQNITSKISKDRSELLKRVGALNNSFIQCGFSSKVCDNEDLSRVNMMFFNPIQAVYEDDSPDSDVYLTTIMKDGDLDD